MGIAMYGLTPLDLFAVAFFIAAWMGYGAVMEWTAFGRRGLNNRMHRYREEWMREMLLRDMRMVDGHNMGSLQNGTAFSPRPRCSQSAAYSRCCALRRT